MPRLQNLSVGALGVVCMHMRSHDADAFATHPHSIQRRRLIVDLRLELCARVARVACVFVQRVGSDVVCQTAVADFPDRCSIAVRSERRCVEPLECLKP